MSEHLQQKTLINMVDWHAKRHPDLAMLYAVPNGSARHKAVAGKLRAEGVRSGVPDLCLPVARGGCHGLYIELKTATGRVQASQRDWMARLEAQGYRAVVCRGWREAWAELTDYLDITNSEAVTHG